MPMNHSFFSRLIERIDPHRPALTPELQHARLMCGRWLAVRRMQLGITAQQLAQQCGVAEERLLFLETGLATFADFSEPARQQLTAALASEPQQQAYMCSILIQALDEREVQPQLVRAVQAELEGAPPHTPN